MAELNQEQLAKLKTEVMEAVIAEVRRRAIEKVLLDNTDRINFYLGKVGDDLVKEIQKEFPL